MHKYTEDELISLGYKLTNAKIISADLSMEDHGCLTFNLWLESARWTTCYGGYCIGHGYLGADDDCFEGSKKGNECIMRIMDVVGVARFSKLEGQYVRVAEKSWGDTIKIIGNITLDQWFDYENFFKEDKEK